MYATIERGTDGAKNYSVFFKNPDGKYVSPLHDIPLMATGELYNMIVEIPRWTNPKMEISTKDPLNPLKQDIMNGDLRYVSNPFPYHGYIWNYGALPQTWEDPILTDPKSGLKGSHDPIRVCEIGSIALKRGQVVPVKVVGVIAINNKDGGMDWKVIAIKADDPIASKLKDIEDVDERLPSLMNATYEWFKNYDVLPKFPALDGRPKDTSFARCLIAKAHGQWEDLMFKSKTEKAFALKNTTLDKSSFKVSLEEAEAIVVGKPEFKKASPVSEEEEAKRSQVCYVKINQCIVS